MPIMDHCDTLITLEKCSTVLSPDNSIRNTGIDVILVMCSSEMFYGVMGGTASDCMSLGHLTTGLWL